MSMAEGHAVELFAAPRCQIESTRGSASIRWLDRRKQGPVLRHAGEAVFEEERSAPLKMIAFLGELLNPMINRHHPGHFFADTLSVVEGKKKLAIGHGLASDPHWYLPLGQRFAVRMARNLRAETDSSFSAGRCSATALFIASLTRQDQYRFLSVEQHGSIEQYVLV